MKKLFFALMLIASTAHSIALAQSLNEWLVKQEKASWEKLKANLSPEGTRTGVVIASPSREPNYIFHWVRDAALVMDVLMVEARINPNADLIKHINQYIDFSHYIQDQPTLSDLGEPKYNIDGTGYTGPWGRPQNDGPALRALFLIRYAKHLLSQGTTPRQLSKLYQADMPATSLIKRDLEYTAHRWSEANFDLWEEVKGSHFYTLLAQRQALLEGAELARIFKDEGAATFYAFQSVLIENRLASFVENDHFVTTRDRVDGLGYKYSNLDTSILLAFLHVGEKAAYRMTDSRLARTVELLAQSFTIVYPLNQRGIVAVALGRYPEDQYYGGNPWILTTLAVAEYHYRMARLTGDRSHLTLGDSYMERVKFHSREDGAMAEQWDRYTGFQVSADELTWSHAAFITAMRERRAVHKLLGI
jgi:glucoamylase